MKELEAAGATMVTAARDVPGLFRLGFVELWGTKIEILRDPDSNWIGRWQGKVWARFHHESLMTLALPTACREGALKSDLDQVAPGP